MKKLFALILVLGLSAATIRGAVGKFYNDDPIAREPDTRDASGAKPWDIDLAWDLVSNLFGQADNENLRAQNINTIDELPDSNWFTNRILAHPLSVADAVKGPLVGDGPAPPPWTIIRPKQAGAAPGFTMRDSRGDVWFVSFDAAGYPEAATAAIVVANKIFWALGYWQVENFLISIKPGDVSISDDARIRVPSGERRPLRRSDLDEVFRHANRSPDGSYRAVAGKGLPGTVLGGFRYAGTRPDDPNDVIPHQHRRELRALKVFGAWTNLVDMKAGNTVDTVVEENGKKIVRHYLQDVGSTFGTAALGPHDYDEGWEYLFEGSTAMKRLVTFGLYLRPWQTARYQQHPSIGRFEAAAFNPPEWRPRVPTAAYLNARSDDNFWAARRVMAFSEEMIRAVVKSGDFSDPAAEKLLADTLIARRNKIGAAYLPAVNPLVNFTLDSSSTLTFTNAAVASGVATAPSGGYTANWGAFDNMTSQTQPIGTPTAAPGERIQAPAGLPAAEGSFIRVQVSAVNSPNASWAVPVEVYFRRMAGAWKLVGLERLK